MGVGSVYLVSGGGLVKVGLAQDVEQRLRGLTNSSPYPLRIISSYQFISYAKARQVEQSIHCALWELKCGDHGEWFRLFDTEVELLRVMLAERVNYEYPAANLRDQIADFFPSLFGIGPNIPNYWKVIASREQSNA